MSEMWLKNPENNITIADYGGLCDNTTFAIFGLNTLQTLSTVLRSHAASIQ